MSQERKKRVPFGVPQRKLNVDAATRQRYAGKVLRWIKDADGRISNAQAGGYEFVTGEVETGDAKKQEEKDRRVKKPAGRGQTLYLMAIPKEYYDEDQKVKEETNANVDRAIRGGQPTGLQPHGVPPSQGSSTVKNIDYSP